MKEKEKEKEQKQKQKESKKSLKWAPGILKEGKKEKRKKGKGKREKGKGKREKGKGKREKGNLGSDEKNSNLGFDWISRARNTPTRSNHG